MGSLNSRQLNRKDWKHLSGCTKAMLRDFLPLFRHQLCASLLEHEQDELEPRDPLLTWTVLQQHDAEPVSDVLLEGTLHQYLDGKWKRRHLQVTKDFAVESRNFKEVYTKGWECRRNLVLTGCQICTTIQEHRHLVDKTCQHITGVTGRRGGRMPFWECPTDFPVFVQHPYDAPLCLCAESREMQLLWAQVLKRAVHHQSTVLQRSKAYESKAFLEAVRFYKQGRVSFGPKVLVMGSEDEVLSSLVMEEVLPSLREQIFPRMIMPQSWRRLVWIKLQADVYSHLSTHVRTELTILLEEQAHRRPLLEKQIRSDLHQMTTLQDSIAHKMKEDLSAELSQCLSRVITPHLEPTIQEVATPICSGFAAARQLFLETCDDVITRSNSSQSMQELLSPPCGLSLNSTRVLQYLTLLEWSPDGQAWLQASWGIHSGLCRPLVLQAQSTLQQQVENAATVFKLLLSRELSFSLDWSQLKATVRRIRDRLLKQLDHDLRTLRLQLIRESVLQLCLPTLLQGLGQQDLSRYEQLVYSDYSPFLRPDIIYRSVLTDALASELGAVMRDSLPEQCWIVDDWEIQSAYQELAPPGGSPKHCHRKAREWC